jgi:opacity protein-like surface antigen
MKKTSAAILLFVMPLPAFAVGGYIEGNLGYTFVSDADLKGSAATVEAGTLSNGELKYDDGVGYGLEIGIRNFESHNVLRLGLAWNRFDADLDELEFDASGGTVLPAGRYSLSSGELESVGLDFDNTVDVYTVNIYYDIPTSEKFTFFVGGGIGIADVENAKDEEFAFKLALGGRYQLGENAYLGLRYDYIGIDDLEDDSGDKYENVSANVVSATLGFNF